MGPSPEPFKSFTNNLLSLSMVWVIMVEPEFVLILPWLVPVTVYFIIALGIALAAVVPCISSDVTLTEELI